MLFDVKFPLIFNVLINMHNFFSELIRELNDKRIDRSSESLVRKLDSQLYIWMKGMESCFYSRDLKCINSELDKGINLKVEIEDAIIITKQKLITDSSVQVYENEKRIQSFGALIGSITFGSLALLAGGLAAALLPIFSAISFGLYYAVSSLKLDRLSQQIINRVTSLEGIEVVKDKFNKASDYFKKKFKNLYLRNKFK